MESAIVAGIAVKIIAHINFLRVHIFYVQLLNETYQIPKNLTRFVSLVYGYPQSTIIAWQYLSPI